MSSREPQIAVVRWISPGESEGKEVAFGGLGGWFNSGPTWNASGHCWQDYLASWKEVVRPYCEALRREVVRLNLRRGGDWHQQAEEGTPLFSDGKIASFSMRAWGDLLAAIWTATDGRPYNYMDFYMDREEEVGDGG